MDDDPAVAELTRAVVAGARALPELDGAGWDTYALVAEVDDATVRVTAYRYAGAGPPVPTDAPEDDDLLWDLRDRMRRPDGETWDVVLLRLRRRPAGAALRFLAGEAADRWRVTPDDVARLPEALRPRPEDFPPA